MSGAGRGVTPGAEPDAGSDREVGSDREAESPALDQGQAVHSDEGAAGSPWSVNEPPEDQASASPARDESAASAGGGATDPADSDSSAGSAGTPGGKTATRSGRGGRFLRELVILIVVALLIAVGIKTYAVQAFFIPSGSMENTLEINDRVLVNKIVYDTRSIHRGDIIVFNGDGSWDPGPAPANSNFVEKFASGFASMFGFGRPGDILIKRVIGLPGDRVACCDAEGRVTVNGIPLSEQAYLYPGAVPSQVRFTVTVQPGRLWVMGDNRAISADSRDHEGDPGGGTIPENAVIGRAFVIIWPPSRWRILPIPATFEQPKLNESSAATPASIIKGTNTEGASAKGVTAASAGAEGAAVLSARLEPSNPTLPLVLGFAVALPVSWLQRRVRIRATRRRVTRRNATNRRISGPPGP